MKKEILYKTISFLLMELVFLGQFSFAGVLNDVSLQRYSSRQMLAVPLAINKMVFQANFVLKKQRKLLDKPVPQKPAVRRKLLKDEIDFRLPAAAWKHIKNRVTHGLLHDTKPKIPKPRMDFEQFWKCGLGWSELGKEGRVLKSLGAYESANNFFKKHYDIGPNLDGEDFKQYVRFYLRVYNEFIKYEKGKYSNKRKMQYSIVNEVKERLGGQRRFKILLRFFEQQYGAYSEEDSEQDEDTVIRSILAMMVANRSLGIETILLVDDSGNELALNEFWPYAQYIINDALWFMEPRFKELSEIMFMRFKSRKKSPRRYPALRDNFNRISEVQTKEMLKVENLLSTVAVNPIGLRNRIIMLDADLMATFGIMDIVDHPRVRIRNRLSEDLALIRRVLIQSDRAKYNDEARGKIFNRIKKKFIVIKTYEQFLHAAQSVVRKNLLDQSFHPNPDTLSKSKLHAMIYRNLDKDIRWMHEFLKNKQDLVYSRDLMEKIFEENRPNLFHISTFDMFMYTFSYIVQMEEIEIALGDDFNSLKGSNLQTVFIQNLNDDIEIIKEYIQYSNKRIFEKRDLETIYTDLEESLMAIRSFDVFLHVVHFQVNADDMDVFIKTDLNFSSGLDSFLKSKKRKRAERLDVLMKVSAMTEEKTEKALGLSGGNLGLLRSNKNGFIEHSLFLKLAKLFSRILPRKISPTVLYSGLTLEDLMRREDTFGGRVYALRKICGISRLQLAKILKRSKILKGVHIHHLNLGILENQERLPRNEMLYYKLAVIFNEFIGGKRIDASMLMYGVSLDELLYAEKVKDPLSGSELVDLDRGIRFRALRISAGATIEEMAAVCEVNKATIRAWGQSDKADPKMGKAIQRAVEFFNKKIADKTLRNLKKKPIDFSRILTGKKISTRFLLEDTTLGQRLVQIREAMGLLPQEMSEELKKLGINREQTAIIGWENDQKRPSVEIMLNICKIYKKHVKLDSLDACLLIYGRPVNELISQVKGVYTDFKLVKYVRIYLGITLKDLSDKLGFNAETLARMERGKYLTLSVESMEQLINLLGQFAESRDKYIKDQVIRLRNLRMPNQKEGKSAAKPQKLIKGKKLTQPLLYIQGSV